MLSALWEKSGVEYDIPILEFGEAYLGRTPGEQTEKLAPQWQKGIWLGRNTASDENLVGTKNGILGCRTIKRTNKGERFQKKVLDEMIGLPWDVKGLAQIKQREGGTVLVPMPRGGARGAATMPKT